MMKFVEVFALRIVSFTDPGGSKKASFQNHHIATKIVPCRRAREADSNGKWRVKWTPDAKDIAF